MAAAGDLLSPAGFEPGPLRRDRAPACTPGDVDFWMSCEEASLRELNILGRQGIIPAFISEAVAHFSLQGFGEPVPNAAGGPGVCRIAVGDLLSAPRS